LGADGGWFQEFTFNAGVRILTNENQFVVVKGETSMPFKVEVDFRPLSFSSNGDVDGEVVFAGYGLTVPGKPGEGYDSYAGLNVSNKVVFVLRYVPEGVSAARRAELNRYAGLRYKAMQARERGARAILFVTGPNSPHPGELASLTFDGSLAGSGIVAASIDSKVAGALLAASGRDLKTSQSALDTENPHAESGFLLAKTRVRLATHVEHLKKTDRNVLGVLSPARGPSPA